MSSPLSRAASAAAPAAAETVFSARLSVLYSLAQQNRHLFASPLGSLIYAGRQAWLPRFVFFGPHASDASWRLAFLSGFDARDLRPSLALLGPIEHLARSAEDGHGLDLTFFPIVDAAGLFGAPPRPLTAEHWGRTAVPEIDLLEKDARTRGYHGYIRIEPAAPGEDILTLRVREPLGVLASPDVELISSEDVDPFPVRFERGESGVAPADGPLSIADDLPVQPFELTLRIPSVWPDEVYQDAVTIILTRFLHRYRAFQAYGQHL
jgi:hypothetical protein